MNKWVVRLNGLMLMFLFVLVSNVWATGTTVPTHWVITVTVGLLLGGLLLLLLFMLAKLFQLPRFESILHLELEQLVATALLLVIVIILLKSSDTLGLAIVNAFDNTSTSTGTLYEIVEDEMSNTEDLLSNYRSTIIAYYERLAEQSGKSGSAYFWGVGYTDSSCSGNGFAQPMITSIINLLVFTSYDLAAVKILITAGVGYFFPFFITFGAILRIFKVTRRWGGILITIGLAFYPIMPLTFLLMESVGDTFLQETGVCNHSDDYFQLNPDTCKIEYLKRPYCFEFNTEYVWDVLPSIKTVSDEMLLRSLGSVLLAKIYIPTLVIIFIFATFVGGVGSTLGGSINVFSLTRFI